jgi:hypothetical protein
MGAGTPRWIMHLDMDAFYAAVEHATPSHAWPPRSRVWPAWKALPGAPSG